MSNFAARSVCARNNFAIMNDSAANTGSKRNHNDSGVTFSTALPKNLTLPMTR